MAGMPGVLVAAGLRVEEVAAEYLGANLRFLGRGSQGAGTGNANFWLRR